MNAVADSPRSTATYIAEGLALAASPVFSLLAWISFSDPLVTMCSGSSMSSMTAMYGAMAVFHLSPWLRLMGLQARSTRRTRG